MTALWPPDLFAGVGTKGEGISLWNAFAADAGRPRTVGDLAITYDFVDDPAPARAALLIGAAGRRLPIVAVVEAFPFRELSGAELGVDDLPLLPPELRRAIEAGMLANLRRALGFEIDGLGDLDPIGSGSLGHLLPLAADGEWLRLTLEGGSLPGPVRALLRLPRALVVEHLRPRPGAAPGPIAAGLALDVDLTLGAIGLGLREFAALEPGDVVVLEETDGNATAVRVGQVGFTFTRSEAGWISSGPRSLRHANRPAEPAFPGRNTMTEPTEDAAAPDDGFDLADLPLTVDFDLARVTLPYSTVAGWTAGAVIDLAPPSTEGGVSVTIRVNGEAVGSGDIVRIDDRIGVRITRLLRPSRP